MNINTRAYYYQALANKGVAKTPQPSPVNRTSLKDPGEAVEATANEDFEAEEIEEGEDDSDPAPEVKMSEILDTMQGLAGVLNYLGVKGANLPPPQTEDPSSSPSPQNPLGL